MYEQHKTPTGFLNVAFLLVLAVALSALAGCSKPEDKLGEHLMSLADIMNDNRDAPEEGVAELRFYLRAHLPEMLELAATLVVELDEIAKQAGKPLVFVGADRQPHAGGFQPVHRFEDAGKQPRLVGDMVLVIGDEARHLIAHLGIVEVAAVAAIGLAQHHLGAMAGMRAHDVERHRRHARGGKAMVEARGKIGGGVDERAVEVEDGDAGHDLSLQVMGTGAGAADRRLLRNPRPQGQAWQGFGPGRDIDSPGRTV